MSNKTIQDALAEVQRKVNEERAERVAEMISEVQRGERYNPKTGKYETPLRKIKPDTSVGKQTLTAEPTTTTTPKTTTPSTPKTGVPVTGKLMPGASTTGKTLGTIGKIGGAASMAGTGALGAAGLGGMASGAIGALATGTETGREIGRKIGQTEIGKTVADVARKAGEAIGVREPSQAKPAETPKPTELPKIDVPAKQTTPAPSQTKKPEPSSFGAAFKAAREKATEMGNPSTGQFEYKGKEYQTNIKGEKYVPMPQQTKVGTGTTTAPKPETSTTTSAATPAPKTPDTSTSKPSETPLKDFVKNAMTGNYETPIMDRIKGKTPEESESGGKKKKMSEETNPMIAAFLKLQESNPQNMFEAAKKAKKDYDKDGKIESPKDEVWGSRFAAAKKAGKMEETNMDPVVTGSSSVTKSKTGYVDPSTPTEPYKKAPVSTAAGDVLDKAKNALDKTGVKEEAEQEITFSQAEIDHINSFFLEASVAPNRPEVATGADSVSDKMSQNDVTGTSTESGGKKKVKEETDAADETNMAKTQLKAMSSKAMNLHSKLKTSKNLPAWVQSKLAVAKDGVTAVDDYMTHSGKIKEDIELEEGDLTIRTLYNKWAGHASGYNEKSGAKANAVEKAITKVHGPKVMSHLKKALNANLEGDFDRENSHFEKARTAAGKSEMIGATVGSGRSEFRKTNIDEASKPEVSVYDDAAHVKDKMGKVVASYSKKEHGAEYMKKANAHMSKIKEEVIQEGRPKKNPEPESTERDPRKHIQVEAGRAAAGNVIDFHHNDGTKSKITPAMGRRITSHLNTLKPADRQAAVNKMHDSAEGLKV